LAAAAAAAGPRPRLLQLDPFKETSGVTPVQGIHPDGPVSEKGPSHSCDRFSGSLDTWIDLHPPILSDPLDTLEEVFGLGQKTSRDKQIRFLSVFLNRAENDAWPWIGEKPTPLTRLKAGSSQGDGTCLHFSGGLGRSPRLARRRPPPPPTRPRPLAQPPHSRLPNLTLPHPTPIPATTEGGPGRDGCLSPGSEMSLVKPL
jgi:hypothetical protein